MPSRPPTSRAVFAPIAVLALLVGACEREREVFRPRIEEPAEVLDTGPIQVGVLTSLSGRDAATGLAEWRGIVLAVEERNAGPLTNGREVQLALLDDQSRTEAAARAGVRFATSDRVVLVLGGTRGERAQVAAERVDPIPLVSTTWPYRYRTERETAFGGAAVAVDVARACASLALFERDFAGRVEVVARAGASDERAVAQAIADAVSTRAKTGAARVSVATPPGPEPTACVAAWASDPPAAVILAFDGADAARVVALARKRGLASTRFVVVGEPDFAALPDEAVALLDDTLVLTTFDRAAEADFVRRFRARFDADPNERAWRAHENAVSALRALDVVPAFWPSDVHTALERRIVPRLRPLVLVARAGHLSSIGAPPP